MSNEIELKFEIDDQDIAPLTGFLSVDPINLTLSNTYYDTADYFLLNHGCGLRVRGIGERYEITLKRDKKGVAGFSERAEFNVDLKDSYPDLRVLPEQALPHDALADNGGILQLQQMIVPLFTTNFQRLTWLIEYQNSRIEVALDRGQIASANQQLPIQEVELELKSGNKSALLSFAIQLSQFHLHLLAQSKASRGYRLAQNMALAAPSCPLTELMDTKIELSQLLHIWQSHEEYALAQNNLSLYITLLQQVADVLSQKQANFSQPIQDLIMVWQSLVTSSCIDSVKTFAYSEINTKLKLHLISTLYE